MTNKCVHMFGISVEVFTHMAKSTMRVEMPAIEGDDATRFLASMLQGMQAEGGEHIRLIRPINAKNGAFFLQLVVIIIRRGEGVYHWLLASSSRRLKLVVVSFATAPAASFAGSATVSRAVSRADSAKSLAASSMSISGA